MTVTDVNQLVSRFEQSAKMMKTMARGGTPNIPGMGPMAGISKPGASSKRGNKKGKGSSGSRSGNPAKRAAENAGLTAAPTQSAGSGFGLGGKQAPSADDLAEIQKLFGKG